MKPPIKIMEEAMVRSVTRVFILLIGLSLLSVTTVFGFDFSELENSVTEFTLENGLKIIVMERHEAPVISFVTFANVGAVDDPKGYTGLAHMFEHMAFKGTTTLGTKDIKKELELIAVEDSVFLELRAERKKGRLADSAKIEVLEAAYDEAREASYEYVVPNELGNVVEREGGIGLNAGTGYDFTVYFMNFPSNRLELWMALESERFLNPVLREMYKERDVVAEERRMRTDSNPFGRLFEEFLAVAFKAHPYGIPVIGHMSDIQNYSRPAGRAYFEKYYSPSNLTVAIVGDVKPKDVKKLAEQYWGRLPRRSAPERIATVEPEQLGERRVVLEDPSQPIYLVGWHIPEGTHPDRPALDALVDYLGQGRTSLLYKNLVKEKKIAMNVAAFAGVPGEKYPTLLGAFAMASSGHTNEECETEIFKEVEKLKDELISEEDLAKIKARTKASLINQLDDNQGLAFQLTYYQVSWGDWRELFQELDRINAVTAEDVQRVAKKYLTKKNRIVGMINTEES
ncbi:MAG: insulinase family protein [Candidatus Zixiibacteriota bacterium]|nr:MAG: insulinase family protein [candidate division Zixibacteria bacterium]